MWRNFLGELWFPTLLWLASLAAIIIGINVITGMDSRWQLAILFVAMIIICFVVEALS